MRIIKRLLLIAFVLLLIAVGVVWWIYSSVTHVPPAYAELLAAEQAELAAHAEKAASNEEGDEPVETPQEIRNHQMLQRVTELSNDVRRGGEWEIGLTDDMLNGWFAIDLMRNHADKLPAELARPRVLISEDAMTFFVEAKSGGVKTVVSLEVEPTIERPGVVTLRILGLRAGSLPFSVSRFRKQFEKLARQHKAQLVWEDNGDETTIHFTLPTDPDEGPEIRVTKIGLGDGSIYVAGTANEE